MFCDTLLIWPLNCVYLSPGHVNTVMYLLNYYPGIDTEVKDCRGFTALIKAAMTGRNDVMVALLMAGTYEQDTAMDFLAQMISMIHYFFIGRFDY